MKSDPDLFSYAPKLPYNGSPPAQAHSQTSQEAAEKIRRHIGPLHKRILAYLDHGGATDEQLMEALSLGGNTLRPRRRELQLMGFIVDSGRMSPTRSGRNAVVWVKA